MDINSLKIKNEIIKLNNSSREIFSTDIKTSEKLALKAVMLSRKEAMNRELADSLVNLSNIRSEVGDYLNATDYIFEAISILKRDVKSEVIVKAYRVLGINYLRTGDLDKALSTLNLSKVLSNELGDTIELPSILLGIGNVLSFKNANEDSLIYYEQSFRAAEKTKNIEVQLKALNNLGCSYNSLDRLDEAEDCINRCISISKDHGFMDIVIWALDELGLIYIKRGDHTRAIESWLECLRIDKDRGETINTIAPNLNIAKYYLKTESWELAQQYLNDASRVAKSSNSRLELVKVYKLESQMYEKKGDFKIALDLFKKQYLLEQQVTKQESVRELKEIELEALTIAKERIISISKIGRTITESLDLETTLKRIYTYVKEISDSTIFGIARYNKKSSKISYDIFMEDGIKLPHFETGVEDKNSLAAWCVRNKKRIVINNLENDYVKYVESVWAVFGGVKHPKSIIYLPLLVGDEFIGLITVQSYKENAYSVVDVDSFDILSSYAAIALNNARQSEMIRKQNKELVVLATLDSLTGIKNRRAFFEDVRKCRAWARRLKVPHSFILLDLDHFKKINDKYGHPAGDFCLIEVAKILNEVIKRDNDEVGRFGGEEFCISLGDADINGAKLVAEKIRSKIEGFTFIYDGININITASFGISTAEPHLEHKKSIGNLLSEADKAMYKAKKSGRNCVKIYR
ncbi:MAG: GGDEF domain-containing protein [Spirochaetaceae bacterium]